MSLVPYRSTLLPARPSREVRQALAGVYGHELVARARIAAVVRVVHDAQCGVAALAYSAGVLAARDPLAADDLIHITRRGIDRLGAIVDNA